MSKGQKHMNLINCHAARIHLPISLQSSSLIELTVQILLDLELYRMLKNNVGSGVPSVN